MGLFFMSDQNDYLTRLTSLSDKLLNVAIEECNPDNWQSANKRIKDLTVEERGNRYWDKKNAAGSLTILIKVQSLIGMQGRQKPGEQSKGAGKDDDVEGQIKKAEKEVEKILDRVLNKA